MVKRDEFNIGHSEFMLARAMGSRLYTRIISAAQAINLTP